jgi:hypothetical protein
MIFECDRRADLKARPTAKVHDVHSFFSECTF